MRCVSRDNAHVTSFFKSCIHSLHEHHTSFILLSPGEEKMEYDGYKHLYPKMEGRHSP